MHHQNIICRIKNLTDSDLNILFTKAKKFYLSCALQSHQIQDSRIMIGHLLLQLLIVMGSCKPKFNCLFLVCLFYNQCSIRHCHSKVAPVMDHSLSATSLLCPQSRHCRFSQYSMPKEPLYRDPIFWLYTDNVPVLSLQCLKTYLFKFQWGSKS